MSANTSITEGGKPRPFGPVKVLMVQGEDGKYYPWYPEADRALSTLSVDKNGIYRASDRGVYGWSSVIVNVATTDHVTGKDPDTGEEVVVRPDPETGEITETVVPVEIRVETPPTFTGPYGDGAYIDFTGLTVAAYGANGNKMQDVPFSELIFPVTVTDYAEATGDDGIYTKGGITALGIANDTYLPNRAGNYVSAPLYMYHDQQEVMGTTEVAQTAFVTQYNGEFYVAMEKGGSWTSIRFDPYWGQSIDPITQGSGNPYIFIRAYNSFGELSIPSSDTNPLGADFSDAEAQYKQQSIPVQWQRPGDGAILETSFLVSVVDVSPNNNDGN